MRQDLRNYARKLADKTRADAETFRDAVYDNFARKADTRADGDERLLDAVARLALAAHEIVFLTDPRRA